MGECSAYNSLQTHDNNGARVSVDEVPKKLKQNINTVHIFTLMVAFQNGTIPDVATKVGDYNKTGDVPRPQPQTVTGHMMPLGEQMSTGNRRRLKVNTLINGKFSLATGLSCLLAYSSKSPRRIVI